MSVKDFSKAWDEAAQRALQTTLDPEIAPERLASAAGLRVRTGVAAGGLWGVTDEAGCSADCSSPC